MNDVVSKAELQPLIEAIERVNYQALPGPLRNFVPWIELREKLGMPPTFVPPPEAVTTAPGDAG